MCSLSLQTHVSWMQPEHVIVVKWGGSETFSCVRVRSAVYFPSFADSPYHVISFSRFLIYFFFRKMQCMNCPCEWKRRGKEQRNGLDSLESQLPFDLCLLNITSAEVRDHQEAKTMAGKQKHVLPPSFYVPNTLWIVMLLWTGKLGLREFTGPVGFDHNKKFTTSFVLTVLTKTQVTKHTVCIEIN